MYDVKRVICRECEESIGSEEVAAGKDLICFACEDRSDQSKRLRMEFETAWEPDLSDELTEKMASSATGTPARDHYRRHDERRRYSWRR